MQQRRTQRRRAELSLLALVERALGVVSAAPPGLSYRDEADLGFELRNCAPDRAELHARGRAKSDADRGRRDTARPGAREPYTGAEPISLGQHRLAP